MDFKQADFFEQACTAVVLSSLRIFNKIETFGKRFYIDPENRTRVSPEFFIRFTDGSTVMLTWYDTSNELHVSVAFDGGIYYGYARMPISFTSIRYSNMVR